MFVAPSAARGTIPVRRRAGRAIPAALVLHRRVAIRERLRGFFQQGERLRVAAEASGGTGALETLRRYQLDYFLCELSDEGLLGLRRLRENGLDVPTAFIFEGEPDSTLLGEAMRLNAKVCFCVDDLAQAMVGVEALTAGRTHLPPECGLNPLTRADLCSLVGFTERDKMILGWLAENRSPSAMASELFLSTSTVKGYLSALYLKLGVSRRSQAIEAARGLLL